MGFSVCLIDDAASKTKVLIMSAAKLFRQDAKTKRYDVPCTETWLKATWKEIDRETVRYKTVDENGKNQYVEAKICNIFDTITEAEAYKREAEGYTSGLRLKAKRNFNVTPSTVDSPKIRSQKPKKKVVKKSAGESMSSVSGKEAAKRSHENFILKMQTDVYKDKEEKELANIFRNSDNCSVRPDNVTYASDDNDISPPLSQILDENKENTSPNVHSSQQCLRWEMPLDLSSSLSSNSLHKDGLPSRTPSSNLLSHEVGNGNGTEKIRALGNVEVTPTVILGKDESPETANEQSIEKSCAKIDNEGYNAARDREQTFPKNTVDCDAKVSPMRKLEGPSEPVDKGKRNSERQDNDIFDRIQPYDSEDESDTCAKKHKAAIVTPEATHENLKVDDNNLSFMSRTSDNSFEGNASSRSGCETSDESESCSNVGKKDRVADTNFGEEPPMFSSTPIEISSSKSESRNSKEKMLQRLTAKKPPLRKKLSKNEIAELHAELKSLTKKVSTLENGMQQLLVRGIANAREGNNVAGENVMPGIDLPKEPKNFKDDGKVIIATMQNETLGHFHGGHRQKKPEKVRE